MYVKRAGWYAIVVSEEVRGLNRQARVKSLEILGANQRILVFLQ